MTEGGAENSVGIDAMELIVVTNQNSFVSSPFICSRVVNPR